MKKNIVAVALLLISTISCGQKKIDTVTLSNGKTIAVYDNKTWAYVEGPVKPTPKPARPGADNNSDPSGNNGYQPQKNNNRSSYSSICGARTKKGGACQRKVSGGGRCWQH